MVLNIFYVCLVCVSLFFKKVVVHFFFIVSESTADDSTFITWRWIGEHPTWLCKWTIGVSLHSIRGFSTFRPLFFACTEPMWCRLGIWWKRRIDCSFANMKVRRWHIRTCRDHDHAIINPFVFQVILFFAFFFCFVNFYVVSFICNIKRSLFYQIMRWFAITYDIIQTIRKRKHCHGVYNSSRFVEWV